MPSRSGQVDPDHGPLIEVGIAPGGALAAARTQGLRPHVERCRALLDTGASITCIAPAVVAVLQLTPRGKRRVISATQAVPRNLYLVDLLLPFTHPEPVLRRFEQHAVVDFEALATDPVQVLLGRDILGRGVLTVSFDGHFTFSL